MAEITSQQMAGKLLAAGFERSGPSASTLSDPIADTPMVVTLDQLRPYDHDPRKKRNPAYEEIKASIRERGLDAAPAITRAVTPPTVASEPRSPAPVVRAAWRAEPAPAPARVVPAPRGLVNAGWRPAAEFI